MTSPFLVRRSANARAIQAWAATTPGLFGGAYFRHAEVFSWNVVRSHCNLLALQRPIISAYFRAVPYLQFEVAIIWPG
jgi:hypothetical protein